MHPTIMASPPTIYCMHYTDSPLTINYAIYGFSTDYKLHAIHGFDTKCYLHEIYMNALRTNNYAT